MGKIGVHGIKLYAFHGCTDEEQIVGTNYEVDVVIELDLSKPSFSDNLNETVDYVIIYDIVKQEMAIKSRLIEHVAKRISDRLMNQIPAIQKIKVTVAKLHPPINGIVNKVFVELEETR
jgi:dihydroneopterin aldolase